MLCLLQLQARPNVQLHVLGTTLDGRDIHMLQVRAIHTGEQRVNAAYRIGMIASTVSCVQPCVQMQHCLAGVFSPL
jgi:hypothetical protein